MAVKARAKGRPKRTEVWVFKRGPRRRQSLRGVMFSMALCFHVDNIFVVHWAEPRGRGCGRFALLFVFCRATVFCSCPLLCTLVPRGAHSDCSVSVQIHACCRFQCVENAPPASSDSPHLEVGGRLLREGGEPLRGCAPPAKRPPTSGRRATPGIKTRFFARRKGRARQSSSPLRAKHGLGLRGYQHLP